jgi:glycerol-3-phosphate dehydrogenase
MDPYDVIIIGGGVVGCLTARYLSRYQLKILLIDKESDVGSGTSAANSALIHAGYDPLPGTLKAILNVRGNELWSRLSQELEVDFKRCGDYVVAIGEAEFEQLSILKKQGEQNGVPGLELISGEEIQKRIPSINPAVSGALYAPTAGICDTFGVTVAAAENALMNGVEIKLDTSFEDFIFQNGRIAGIRTNYGEYFSNWVINAAGVYADEVMHKAGCRPEFKIHPRRGEYCILDPDCFSSDTILFPVPSDKGKGVLIFGTTHGNTVVGPTSEFVEDKEDKSISPEGMDYLEKNMKKLIPAIDLRWTIASFSGLRASGNALCLDPAIQYTGDFVVELAENIGGLINCAGIESPGLTAAPAIAERVCDLLCSTGLELKEKETWNPIRKRRPSLKHISYEERAKLIAQDPRYGRIVCRCEMVTEGEITAEIHAPLPAKTYDAVKRRTWAGTGRCQGGFDMIRIVDILSRELGIPAEEVSKKGKGSELIFHGTKDIGGDR